MGQKYGGHEENVFYLWQSFSQPVQLAQTSVYTYWRETLQL